MAKGGDAYNNEYEAINKSYMITPGDDLYFFEGK